MKRYLLTLFCSFWLLLAPLATQLPATSTRTLSWTDSIDEQWDEDDPCKVISYKVNYKVPNNKLASVEYYQDGQWKKAESTPDTEEEYGILVSLPADPNSKTNTLKIRYDESLVHFFNVQAVDQRGLISVPSNEVSIVPVPQGLRLE